MKVAEVFKPEWDRECWVVALEKLTGAKEMEIKNLARKYGWEGTFGATVTQAVAVLWELTDKKPEMVIRFNHMTPRELSGKTDLDGLVFTKGHVMPMVNGKTSNFNGYGDDPIIAVALKK